MGKHCFPNLPPHKNAPLSAAVESDTVGYTTIELTKKYTLVGINFSSLDGSNSLPVNDVVSGDFSDGDQLQLQDDTGSYTVLEWKGGSWCGYGTSTPATIEVKRGTGVWLVSHNGASIDSPVQVQLKGGVNLSENLSTTFGNSYVIAATGLPVDAMVNGPLFKWENLVDGDELQIPDETGSYTVLVWNSAQEKWCPFGASYPATVTIPKETAVWVVSANANAKVTVSPEQL